MPTRPAVSSSPLPARRSFPSFWTLHLAGWTVLGLSMWIGVLPHAESPALSLAHKMIFALVGGVLTLGLRPLYRREHLDQVLGMRVKQDVKRGTALRWGLLG